MPVHTYPHKSYNSSPIYLILSVSMISDAKTPSPNPKYNPNHDYNPNHSPHLIDAVWC